MSVSGRRILIVDENPDSAEVLEMALQDMQMDVLIVGDGRSALEALDSYQPSAVLLDSTLPDMDACELARRIRDVLRGGELTLVAISGYSQEEDVRRSRDAGIDHHLAKPLVIGELERALGLTSNAR